MVYTKNVLYDPEFEKRNLAPEDVSTIFAERRVASVEPDSEEFVEAFVLTFDDGSRLAFCAANDQIVVRFSDTPAERERRGREWADEPHRHEGRPGHHER